MAINYLVNLFLRCASINALSGSEKPVADFISSFLQSYNYQITEDNSKQFTSSNTGNIICKIGDGGEFVLLSHMDTARPTVDLKPLIKEDKIVSSGDTVLGVDNRAGIAALLYTLERIAKEKIPVKDFTVAFTTCEETTLFGSKYLELDKKIKRAFIFDSGYRPGSFIYSACGAMAFKISVIGKASHSGIAPEKGINSLQTAAKAISKLPLGRIDDETTMNIGILKGGSAVNVIPELTELEGEVRSFIIKKVEEHFNLIMQVFNTEAESSGAQIECEHNWDFKPFTVPADSLVYEETVRAIEKVGLNPTPKISLGGSDANSLNERGIESVNLGIGAQNPHSNDEFIFIEDLVKSSEIALELIKKD
ncbi:MAG: M20/M25/M40 family metallo-hydrolase [Ignavibacteriaceae bacterium]|nr:M20/M25/M40 family metallo-hydrolase [Ignavibacteriaceae bacterium]